MVFQNYKKSSRKKPCTLWHVNYDMNFELRYGLDYDMLQQYLHCVKFQVCVKFTVTDLVQLN